MAPGTTSGLGQHVVLDGDAPRVRLLEKAQRACLAYGPPLGAWTRACRSTVLSDPEIFVADGSGPWAPAALGDVHEGSCLQPGKRPCLSCRLPDLPVPPHYGIHVREPVWVGKALEPGSE